jgi:hypothetical protein
MHQEAGTARRAIPAGGPSRRELLDSTDLRILPGAMPARANTRHLLFIHGPMIKTQA